MLERRIEKALVKKGKSVGIRFLKFKTPSRRDVPDRIAFLDNAVVIFIECKRPGEKLRPGQQRYCDELLEKGFAVFVLDSLEEVDDIIEEAIWLSKEGH